jgi:hypothetical protein
MWCSHVCNSDSECLIAYKITVISTSKQWVQMTCKVSPVTMWLICCQHNDGMLKFFFLYRISEHMINPSFIQSSTYEQPALTPLEKA